MHKIADVAMASRPHRWKALAAVTAALLVPACGSPSFRASVGEFGTLTKASSTAFDQRLDAIGRAEAERVRAELAATRSDLRFSDGCALLMNPRGDVEEDDDAGNGDVARTAPRAAGPATARPLCEVGVFQGAGRPLQRLPETPRFAHIRSLTAALASYGASLALLAGDTQDQQKEFATAVGGVATSVAGLDAAIRDALGAQPGTSARDLGAIANLASRLGNLYLEHRRDRTLRQVIIAADPFIQDAVRLLTGASAAGDLFELQAAHGRLRAAREAADPNRPANAGPALRVAQDRLFEAVAAYNNLAVPSRGFVAIGAAHRDLAAAARAGASEADLLRAIQTLLDLASTTHQTITTLRGDGGTGQ